MTLKTSFILGLAVAALTVVPTAFGEGRVAGSQDQHPDFWNYDQLTGQKVASSSPGVAPQDLALLHAGAATTSVSVPDAHDRSVQSPTAALLDASDRSTSTAPREVGTQVMNDALERGDGGIGVTTAKISDAFDRGVPQTRPVGIPGDSHDRIVTSQPTPGPVASSGREFEWPQLGIGFGVGILLAFGLLLAMRATRIRPLAH